MSPADVGPPVVGHATGVDDRGPTARRTPDGGSVSSMRVADVEEQQEVVVGDPVAASVTAGDAVTVEVHAQRLAAAVPVVVLHGAAVGVQPDDVVELLAAAHRRAGEEPLAAEGRVLLPKPDQRRGELRQRPVGLVPVHPGDLGVLRVGVVVAVLGATELVAVQDHRHALAQQQRGQQVALLAGAQRQHLGVVGRTLDAVVPGAVVALAVVVVLAVGLVVLLVVGDQVAQGEAVVRGDEVDAGERPATGVLVEVGGAGESGGELTQRRLAAPEVAHGVAVGAVPLRPLGREVADLVATGTDVPRLGDQLHLADDRVLLHELEERGQPVDLVELARQRRGEVEAEAVDVHLGDPVAQRVHDQLQRVRVADVEGVPRARVVHVVLRLVLHRAGSRPGCRCP